MQGGLAILKIFLMRLGISLAAVEVVVAFLRTFSVVGEGRQKSAVPVYGVILL